jgi:hypothetical protein
MTDTPEPPRFVTIEFFWKEMLGLTNKQWFYNHKDDPGFPRRVYFGSKPMLIHDECVAYIARMVGQRTMPEPEKKNPPRKPRRVGRPVGPVRKRA